MRMLQSFYKCVLDQQKISSVGNLLPMENASFYKCALDRQKISSVGNLWTFPRGLIRTNGSGTLPSECHVRSSLLPWSPGQSLHLSYHYGHRLLTSTTLGGSRTHDPSPFLLAVYTHRRLEAHTLVCLLGHDLGVDDWHVQDERVHHSTPMYSSFTLRLILGWKSTRLFYFWRMSLRFATYCSSQSSRVAHDHRQCDETKSWPARGSVTLVGVHTNAWSLPSYRM